MVGINPVLALILDLKAQMESGCSVKAGIEAYLQKRNDDFTRLATRWFLSVQHNRDVDAIYSQMSDYRRSLFQLLECGLKGQPIYELLCQLESEVAMACEQELELAMQRLPYKLLIPVLLFLFPAYLILLLGPLITKFLEEMNL